MQALEARLPKRAKQKRRPRGGKWGDNPLVPVRGDRLKDALGWAGLNLYEVQRRLAQLGLKVSRQALAYSIRPGERQVRRVTVERLAEVLRGTRPQAAFARWLRGEQDDPGRGSDWGGPSALKAERLPGAIQLVGAKALQVVLRDAVLFNRLVPGADAEVVAPRLQQLYNPTGWRHALLSDPPGVTGGDLDAAAEALSQFLGLVLAPALDGRSTLRPDASQRLMRHLRQLLTPQPTHRRKS